MTIIDPDIYMGKKVKVTVHDNTSLTGIFVGYNYDYDDDDNIFTEFDIEADSGLWFGFSESEVKSIEIVPDKKKRSR